MSFGPVPHVAPNTSLETQLHNFVRGVQSATGVPGIGVALSLDGQMVQAYAGLSALHSAAPMSQKARFQLGCITKLLTGIVTTELITARQLEADAPIANYIPEMRAGEKGQRITINHLLSH